MSTTPQSAVKELLRETRPDEMKDWLHSIQSHLIATGYCQGLTDEGSVEFAGNFKSLQDFFSNLKKTA